jgi:hypothetical protein
VADPSRRWEGDERGVGIADGAAFRPGVDALSRAMAEPGWVAEDPDAHLLPHVRRACGDSGRFRLVDERSDGALYAVTLEWSPGDATKAALREDVFAVIGAFAEASTHVRQRVLDDAFEFDVTTGMLTDETPFAAHGHLVRLRVVGEAARLALG